jgi:hypothetical protein
MSYMRPLWLKNVRAGGEGHVAGSNRGTFAITAIAAAEVPIQTEFFASEHRSLSELLADQGIAGPQGLNALVNDAQVPETDEDAFLAAIFAEDE